MKRVLYIFLGIVFLGLGWVGVFVPGWPTTVFVLISLWFLIRSNEKLYKKVRSIKAFEQPIKHIDIFEKHRAVSLGVKIISQLFAWSSVLIIFVVSDNNYARYIAAGFAISCSLFMMLIRTYKKDQL